MKGRDLETGARLKQSSSVVGSTRSRLLILYSLPIPALLLASLLIGGYSINLQDAVSAIVGGGRPEAALIVHSIRLPRALAALFGGACLGVSGAILQALFRNPLADSYILGVSAGSSLFLALSMLLGVTLGAWSPTNPYALYLASFSGALLVTALMTSLSGVVRSTTTILIAGLMISYIAYSLTSILQTLVEIEKLRAFTYWIMGSFAGARWSILTPGLPAIAISLSSTLLLAKPLNALLLGEDYARSMGMNLKRTRMMIVAAASLPVAIVTALAGAVGFIGLCAPYLARQLSRTSNHFTIIPASALLGSTLTLAADLLSRLALRPIEIPITGVTALFGAPLVIYLLLRGRGVQL